MSAQIIVLADHRPDHHPAGSLDAALDHQLAGVVEGDPATDPYGLVAAVRALAVNMERMRERSAEMRKTYQSLAEAARAVVVETDTMAESVEGLGGIGASLVCI